MSQPGWYPDPAGNPGHFRYWDGRAWGPQATTDPDSSGPQGSRRPSGNRTWIVAVVVVVIAVVGALVWRQAINDAGPAVDTNSATPSVTGWDETSSATPSDENSPDPSSPPTESVGAAVDCPTNREGPLTVVNGRIKGTISASVIDGWTLTSGFGIPGVRQELGQYLSVTKTWVNVSLVGNAYRADGFNSASETARMITECFTSSAHYPVDSTKKELTNEAIQVEGYQAHHIRTEMYVTNQGPDIKGGVVDIVAVDTGDPDTIGVYLSAVNIGDADTQAQADQVRATLCVKC